MVHVESHEISQVEPFKTFGGVQDVQSVDRGPSHPKQLLSQARHVFAAVKYLPTGHVKHSVGNTPLHVAQVESQQNPPACTAVGYVHETHSSIAGVLQVAQEAWQGKSHFKVTTFLRCQGWHVKQSVSRIPLQVLQEK